MDIFFIGHRDPIFSLIVLFAIILVVASASWAWGIFSHKNQKRRIEKFIQKFYNEALDEKHKQMLSDPDISVQNLALLAQMFSKNGDFEKSIAVYLIALNKTKDKIEKEFVLNELGEVYFKAGFLKRASDVFLQSLKLSPRNPNALRFLMMIDEKLKNYTQALYALNSLEELGASVRAERAYIKALEVIDDKGLSLDEKTAKILALSKDFALLKRMALTLWLKNNLPISNFSDFAPLSEVIDLIYHQNAPLNLDDPEYKALFYAKGVINQKCEIKGFELSVLRALNDANFKRAGLSFNYVCKSCKNSFPIHFYRCPICHELGRAQILPHITEISDENSITF